MEAPVAQPVMAAQPAVAVAVPVVAVAQQPPPSYAAAAPAGGGGGGARPSAWIYPVKGLSHFVQHPALWPYALCPLIIGVIATIIALILIFGGAFVPQQEWLEGWWGSAFLAWIAAFLLCLVEVAIAAIILLQIALGCMIAQTLNVVGDWVGPAVGGLPEDGQETAHGRMHKPSVAHQW